MYYIVKTEVGAWCPQWTDASVEVWPLRASSKAISKCSTSLEVFEDLKTLTKRYTTGYGDDKVKILDFERKETKEPKGNFVVNDERGNTIIFSVIEIK